MRRYWKLLIILLSLHCLVSLAYAEDVLRVNSLRYWNTPDQSRITFDVSSANASQNKVQFFNNPARLVIDLPNTVANKELEQPPASHPLFSAMRVGSKNSTDLRIVIDLKKPLSDKTTTLHTAKLGDNRFVVELLDKGLATQQIAKVEQKTEPKLVANTQEIKAAPIAEKAPQKVVSPVVKAAPEVETKKVAEKIKPVVKTLKLPKQKLKNLLSLQLTQDTAVMIRAHKVLTALMKKMSFFPLLEN